MELLKRKYAVINKQRHFFDITSAWKTNEFPHTRRTHQRTWSFTLVLHRSNISFRNFYFRHNEDDFRRLISFVGVPETSNILNHLLLSFIGLTSLSGIFISGPMKMKTDFHSWRREIVALDICNSNFFSKWRWFQYKFYFNIKMISVPFQHIYFGTTSDIIVTSNDLNICSSPCKYYEYCCLLGTVHGLL